MKLFFDTWTCTSSTFQMVNFRKNLGKICGLICGLIVCGAHFKAHDIFPKFITLHYPIKQQNGEVLYAKGMDDAYTVVFLVSLLTFLRWITHVIVCIFYIYKYFVYVWYDDILIFG